MLFVDGVINGTLNHLLTLFFWFHQPDGNSQHLQKDSLQVTTGVVASLLPQSLDLNPQFIILHGEKNSSCPKSSGYVNL